MKQKIGIVGLGVTGKSVARFFSDQELYIFDAQRNASSLREELQGFALNQSETLINEDVSQLPILDFMVVSPGISSHPVLDWAAKHKVDIKSEIDIAANLLTCPVIAITGSLGKSTMAKLASDLLQKKFGRVFLGGNYGTPLIQAVGKDYDIAVVEVSSFQLETSKTFVPDVAIFLNISENHLDRHKTMQGYIEAKMRIFQNMKSDGVAIVTDDQFDLLPFDIQAQKKRFSTCKALDQGASIKDGVVYIDEQRFVDMSKHIPDQQVLAASLLASHFEIAASEFQSVLDDFSPLEHRQELISIGGIDYINDSKSTTPDATIFALSQVRKPVHLIMCGQNKGIALTQLSSKIQQINLLESITVFGEMGPELYACLPKEKVELVENLDQAVTMLSKKAQVGSAVLFSPGFASFDQYTSMAERGKHFKTLIQEINA